MNTGAIATRYSRALLKLVQETGNGERVCLQVRALLNEPDNMPAELEQELRDLIMLLAQNRRAGELKAVLRSFLEMYYDSVGVVLAHLTTTVPVPGLESRLVPIVERQFGRKVEMDTSVDPSLKGGFVLEVGQYQLDASVRHQIDLIRREFVIQNNRLV